MSASIKDGSLCFVFIDGDHGYSAVKTDIKTWHPKVRPGGYIVGHDYLSPFHPGVKQAVDECFKKVKVCSDGAGQNFRGVTGVECGIWMVIK